jgi:hypothetical protein
MDSVDFLVLFEKVNLKMTKDYQVVYSSLSQKQMNKDFPNSITFKILLHLIYFFFVYLLMFEGPSQPSLELTCRHNKFHPIHQAVLSRSNLAFYLRGF